MQAPDPIGGPVMGKRGPAPAPTNLKLVKGTRKDRVNTSEPLPAVGDPRPPAWLNSAALEVWAEHAPDLIRKQVLTPWDVEEFAAWCDAVARRAEAARHLDQEGEVVEYPVFNRNGELTGHRAQRNHWWMVWKDANAVAGTKGARYGMTPSDRSQLKVGDDASDPKEDFFTA